MKKLKLTKITIFISLLLSMQTGCLSIYGSSITPMVGIPFSKLVIDHH